MSTIADCGFRISDLKSKICTFIAAIRNPHCSDITSEQNMGTGPKSEFGFTLLEVLISLAIVGLTLTVLIHSQILSLRQITKSKYHTIAVFLANEILSDTFMRENLPAGVEDGKFPVRENLSDDEDYPGFSWEREVEDSDIEGLKEIKITVSGPENTQIVLDTYRLNPAVIQTGAGARK